MVDVVTNNKSKIILIYNLSWRIMCIIFRILCLGYVSFCMFLFQKFQMF